MADDDFEHLLGGNGFKERKSEIFYRLDIFDDQLAKINRKIDIFQVEELGKLKLDIAMLKVKSGAWGALGGLIGGVVVALAILKLLGHNV